MEPRKEDDDPFKEELDEILQALEKKHNEVKDIKKGERIRKSAASGLQPALAAGGSKGAQLRYTEDDAYCTAAV